MVGAGHTVAGAQVVLNLAQQRCRHFHIGHGPVRTAGFRQAVVAEALNRKLWASGRNCDAKLLRGFTYAKDLVGLQEQDLLTTRSRRFEVDDWLLEPDALLDGVDPERNCFGSISALELWLKLEAEGVMKHPYGKPGTREKFEAAFESQKAV